MSRVFPEKNDFPKNLSGRTKRALTSLIILPELTIYTFRHKISGGDFLREIFEILAAMLAAYGLWTLLRAFRDRLLYPKRVRQRVNAAVYIDNGCSDLEEIAAYVKYLERDGYVAGVVSHRNTALCDIKHRKKQFAMAFQSGNPSPDGRASE